ncbi:FAD-dependent oxidoreductase [Methylomonas sp. MgM2]
MRLAIIGGVAAGSKAAARARRVNPNIEIVLYQDEAEVSYSACGQPYYLYGLVSNRDALIVRHPANFAKEGINVLVRHRVIKLDTRARKLTVHDLTNDRVFEDGFDNLVIATGARSCRPNISGIELDGVVTLRSLTEMDVFKDSLQRLQPKHAVVVGSGYIGLELVESLSRLGVAVTLLGRNLQVFSRLDPEMSQTVHEYLQSQHVAVLAGDGVAELNGRNGRVTEVVSLSGARLQTDFVVLAMGAYPNVDLAEQAGIAVGATGAIAVDARMQTSVPGIYAAGDCVESRHRITGQAVWQPLGDIANLQGRVAGENAAGGDARFPGVFGTAIFKTFDLNVGLTGLTETAARAAGFDIVSAVIFARDKARYFPGSQELKVKLVAKANDGRLLGAQVIGAGAVDKIVDIAATALLGGLGCFDLENADLAYAPPFSPVLSPMIVAAGALSKLVKPS